MNAPAAKPKHNRGKIVAGIIAGLFLLVALNVGVSVLMAGLADEEPATEAERALLLDVAALTDGMDFEPDPAMEVAKRIEYLDGSYELDYTYDDPREEAPYVTYVLSHERKAADAVATYATQWGAAKLMLKASPESLELVEKEGTFGWGEQSSFGIMHSENGPVGNVFVARKRKLVVYVVISGLYYDDLETFADLVVPYLERAEAHLRTR